MGVNDYVAYEDEDGGDLRGAEDDALALRDVLVDVWNVPPGQVRILLSRDATREAMEEAFAGRLEDLEVIRGQDPSAEQRRSWRLPESDSLLSGRAHFEPDNHPNQGDPMSQLKAVARLRIHEGKLEEFKRAAAEAVRTTREKDTGTLQYEWHFTPDMRECVVLETYRDSDAVLEHMGNVGEILGALAEVADLHIDVFGEPSEELLAASEGMDITFHGRFQSI